MARGAGKPTQDIWEIGNRGNRKRTAKNRYLGFLGKELVMRGSMLKVQQIISGGYSVA